MLVGSTNFRKLNESSKLGPGPMLYLSADSLGFDTDIRHSSKWYRRWESEY